MNPIVVDQHARDGAGRPPSASLKALATSTPCKAGGGSGVGRCGVDAEGDGGGAGIIPNPSSSRGRGVMAEGRMTGGGRRGKTSQDGISVTGELGASISDDHFGSNGSG